MRVTSGRVGPNSLSSFEVLELDAFFSEKDYMRVLSRPSSSIKNSIASASNRMSLIFSFFLMFLFYYCFFYDLNFLEKCHTGVISLMYNHHFMCVSFN